MEERRKREEAEARKARGEQEEEVDETLQDEDLKAIADERLRRAKMDKESKLIIQ